LFIQNNRWQRAAALPLAGNQSAGSIFLSTISPSFVAAGNIILQSRVASKVLPTFVIQTFDT